MVKKREKPNPARLRRANQLYKRDRASLVSTVERYYKVVDTKGAPKAVLISMILEAEFGR